MISVSLVMEQDVTHYHGSKRTIGPGAVAVGGLAAGAIAAGKGDDDKPSAKKVVAKTVRKTKKQLQHEKQALTPGGWKPKGGVSRGVLPEDKPKIAWRGRPKTTGQIRKEYQQDVDKARLERTGSIPGIWKNIKASGGEWKEGAEIAKKHIKKFVTGED